MIISRGFNCAKLLVNSKKLSRPSINKPISRSSGKFFYRSAPTPSPTEEKVTEVVASLLWGWLLYHCINNYDMITGEFVMPDPSQWTDEELGIPPLEAEN